MPPLNDEPHLPRAGFLRLIKQLSDTVDLTGDNAWYNRYRELNARFDSYAVVVCEDTTSGRLVGAASLLVELKFIHNCGKVRCEAAAALALRRGRG